MAKNMTVNDHYHFITDNKALIIGPDGSVQGNMTIPMAAKHLRDIARRDVADNSTTEVTKAVYAEIMDIFKQAAHKGAMSVFSAYKHVKNKLGDGPASRMVDRFYEAAKLPNPIGHIKIADNMIVDADFHKKK